MSREQFERIQEMISRNICKEASGAARQGTALLSSLLRCRRCGRKLMVVYTGNDHSIPRYCCHRGSLDNGEPRCISFGGVAVDNAVAREVLRVVEPGAIQAAAQAVEESAKDQAEILEALQLELQSAHYAASRAQRQYDAVDPDNRLVADELESRWNVALEKVTEAEQRLSDARRACSSSEKPNVEGMLGLARNLGAVWEDPATDVRLKKRILRTLIEEIVVDLDDDASQVVLIVHWKGGVHSEFRVTRRRRGENAAHTSKDTIDAIRVLARICPDEVIASFLSRNGLLTGRGNRWTKERVTSLRSHHKIPCYRPEVRQREGWLNLSEAAAHMGISTTTLRRAIERGDVDALHPLPKGPWLLRREALDSPQIQASFERLRSGDSGPSTPSADQLDLGISNT